MLYSAAGSESSNLSKKDLEQIVADFLTQVENPSRILTLPPEQG